MTINHIDQPLIMMKEDMMFSTVFVAGYGNSPQGHWQEIWHKESMNSYWVEQNDWTNPNCVEWVEALNEVIQSIEGPILLVTHSLGGNTVAEWNRIHSGNILGAFLVAFPDVQAVDFPEAISGYESPPLAKLPFPSVTLASLNDPYASIDRTRFFADRWGSDLISIGSHGHINAESNLGAWPEGKRLLTKFKVSLGVEPQT